jgi:hypothetical protein
VESHGAVFWQAVAVEVTFSVVLMELVVVDFEL